MCFTSTVFPFENIANNCLTNDHVLKSTLHFLLSRSNECFLFCHVLNRLYFASETQMFGKQCLLAFRAVKMFVFHWFKESSQSDNFLAIQKTEARLASKGSKWPRNISLAMFYAQKDHGHNFQRVWTSKYHFWQYSYPEIPRLLPYFSVCACADCPPPGLQNKVLHWSKDHDKNVMSGNDKCTVHRIFPLRFQSCTDTV